MLSSVERETVITFNDAEDTATVYTCNKALQNKLDRFCKESPDIYRVKSDAFSKTYNMPKKFIKVQKPRQLSEENRQKLQINAKNNFGSTKAAE